MTVIQLRTGSVTESGDQTAIELPSGGTMHFHLHFDRGAPFGAEAAGKTPNAWKPFLVGFAAIVVALGSYGLGARSKSVPPIMQPSAEMAFPDAPETAPAGDQMALKLPTVPPADPTADVAAIKQQMQTPPVITPPTGSAEPASNPFGLHP